MTTPTPPIFPRMQIRDIKALNDEVSAIARLMHPDMDLDFSDRLFRDVVRLFIGDFEGYQASNTAYHDLHHTLSTLLATARIMHGVHLERGPLPAREVRLGLAAALFHDTGYIMREGESGGTGAMFTLSHVDRSIEFATAYLGQRGRGEDEVDDVAHLLRATALSAAFEDIPFADDHLRTVACCLSTADLLAQMSDELYLERLDDLHRELSEARVPGLESRFELARSTREFASAMEKRMRSTLQDVGRCLSAHFEARCGQAVDPYREGFRRNVEYLAVIVEEMGPDYAKLLRRNPGRRPPFP